MLVREMIYCAMSSEQLDKRITKLGEKMQSEVNIQKKIKILADISDIVKAIIRKNRKDKEFMKFAQDILDELNGEHGSRV